jgi:hypothetical protein
MKSHFLEMLRSLNGDSYPQVPPPTPGRCHEEAEKPFTLAYGAVPGNWRLGKSWRRFKKRFASIGIFCLTLKGMLF